MRILISVLLLGLVSVALLQEYRPQQRLADKIVFDFNENFSTFSAPTLRAMTFGYSRAASALLWLRFLQQTPPRKVEKNQVSWIYRDHDAITELDPDFYPAYELGGIFLSVITEDKRGAEQILLKGTRVFPERWRIRAYLAYHYQWELLEPDKAYTQYLAGAKLPGAPYLLAVIASSYMNKTGAKGQSIQFIEDMLHDTKDPFMRARFEEKLKKLKKGGIDATGKGNPGTGTGKNL
ncbi:MAG: hypothetical protein ACXVB9_02855 [Bdellovibrionota bacterium]